MCTDVFDQVTISHEILLAHVDLVAQGVDTQLLVRLIVRLHVDQGLRCEIHDAFLVGFALDVDTYEAIGAT